MGANPVDLWNRLFPVKPVDRPDESRRPMFLSIASFYLFIKLIYFYSLVRTQIKFEVMKDHWLFLGVVYTLGIAFLSYALLASWQTLPWASWQIQVARNLGVSPWLAWVGETFILSTLYFKLIARFDEGVIFWTLLLLGVLLVWF